MAENQVKSKQRVADHGEVFTAEREVKAMLDLVKAESERVDAVFLEPACGTGNFCVEILRRKLASARKASFRGDGSPDPETYRRLAFQAVSSIYGVELLEDNVRECRERLLALWIEAFPQEMGLPEPELLAALTFLLETNIVQNDFLLKDPLGKAPEHDIIFSEWLFDPREPTQVTRKEFSLKAMMREGGEGGEAPNPKTPTAEQLSFLPSAEPEFPSAPPKPKLYRYAPVKFTQIHTNQERTEI